MNDLGRADAGFFEKCATLPQSRKRGQYDTFPYPNPKQIRLDQSNGRIFLPKVGWIRHRESRMVLGALHSVTVSHSAGKWFISIPTRREVAKPLPQATSVVGIDVGISRFATLSDGLQLEPLNNFRRHEKHLACAQRSLSRKAKISSNWKKQKARIQRVHVRIANVCRNYLYEASAPISQNHALMCVEDGAQHVEVDCGPARISGQKSDSRSTLDRLPASTGSPAQVAGWVAHFRAAATCEPDVPVLGARLGNNRTKQAEFLWIACGYGNHVDVVDPINVRRRGKALLTSEGPDMPSLVCGEIVQSGCSGETRTRPKRRRMMLL
ncbi:transposase [Paraburkholderia sp. UYCP14C]|uniref:RNA-guided endonuclease InsQ/TnpB family protein n=1 Tax=Paraburkholderia sp. UYCP14C TaxID=2511130 RepID=UPI001020F26B|nr:RNA-guided endonuclease TnpB family protein [Paraburkholderia sp. UYCP14C]RZF26676.1 transposase [Paraburkholderia sp. UYCP14C]